MTISVKIINQQIEKMHDMYPSNETELVRHSSRQLCMAVMMSAQTTDKQVNRVTSKLREDIYSPQDIVDMGLNQLISHISSINYYKSKAKHIYDTAQILISSDWKQRYMDCVDYMYIPADISDLIQLPGIGIKTAKVVSHVLYGSLYIAVDTHIHRVAHRLGRVVDATPERTSDILESKIYSSHKSIAHHSIILFGRYHCKATKPSCDHCPLASQCQYYKSLQKTKKILK